MVHGIKNLREKKKNKVEFHILEFVSSRSAAEEILSGQSSGRRRIRPDTELEIQEEYKVNNNDELWLSGRGY